MQWPLSGRSFQRRRSFWQLEGSTHVVEGASTTASDGHLDCDREGRRTALPVSDTHAKANALPRVVVQETYRGIYWSPWRAAADIQQDDPM